MTDFDHSDCKTDEKNALEKELSDYKYKSKCLFLGASISVIISMMGYKYMRDQQLQAKGKELSDEVDRFRNSLQTIISRDLTSINKLIQTSGYDVGITRNEHIIQLDFNSEQDVRALVQTVEALFGKYVSHIKGIQKLREELKKDDWIRVFKKKNDQWVSNRYPHGEEVKDWACTSIVLYLFKKMNQSDKIAHEFSNFLKILANLNVVLSHKKAKLWGVSDCVEKTSSTFARYQFEMALVKNKLKFNNGGMGDKGLKWLS